MNTKDTDAFSKSADDTINKLLNIPRKTLIYFATTYSPLSFEDAGNMSNENLISTIKNANMLSKVQAVYEDAVSEIEKCKNKYNFYATGYDSTYKKPVSYDKVILDMDNSHMFGKAIFVLLTQLGSMETDNYIYSAEKITIAA